MCEEIHVRDCNFNPAEFSFDDVPDHPSMCLYGMRRCGKTILTRHILLNLRKKIDVIYLFSKTAKHQKRVWDFIHKDYIVHGFDVERFTDIVMTNALLVDEYDDWIDSGKKGEPPEKPKRIMLVFDDVISEHGVRHNKVFKDLFVLGRHRWIGVMILSQNAAASESISLSSRGNLDLCFTSFMNSQDDTDRLANYYFGLEGKRKGRAAIKKITSESHTFAVAMLYKDGRNKLSDYVFKIKAPDPGDSEKRFPKLKKFRIGGDEIWASDIKMDKPDPDIPSNTSVQNDTALLTSGYKRGLGERGAMSNCLRRVRRRAF